MINSLIDVFQSKKITAEQATSVINLVTANKYIYEYISSDTSTTTIMETLHRNIYKHIRENIPKEVFSEISTVLHIVIKNYCKFLENNEPLKIILKTRHQLVALRAEELKKEFLLQLSPDEDDSSINDFDVWILAEKEIINKISSTIM